jgi:hypothetical protein
MKKIILLLTLLVGAIGTTSGCSCNKDIYEFDSVVIEDKTYTCSKSDTKDSSVKLMCDNFRGMSIELEDKDTMVVNFPVYNMENEKEEYKIEDGYIYMKDASEWMRFAKYSDDKIEIEMTGIKVILKK